MNVLIACEWTGRVRNAFRALGHNAWSCDLKPSLHPYHYAQDIHFLLSHSDHWDLMIAFPPCTHLAASGARWWPRKQQEQHAAVAFVRALMDASIPRIAVENPVGRLSTALRRPDQTVQPYCFGDDASKQTCLWLRNLPPLIPTRYVRPRLVNGRRRWANQYDDGHPRATGPARARVRGITFQGIADAMATQWGSL